MILHRLGLALLALLASTSLAPAQTLQAYGLNSLNVSGPASNTDTFAVCQVAAGCGVNNPLTQMTLNTLGVWSRGLFTATAPLAYNPNSGAFSISAAGSTSGMVLTSTGPTTPPTFQNPTGGTGTPGGSSNQVQYNNAGAFAGITNGTTGQVLTAQASGPPAFQAPAAGGGIVAGSTTVSPGSVGCPSGQSLINNGGVVGCQAAAGGGTVTSVGLAPGLTTTVGTQNPGTNAITASGTISGQLWPVAVAANCNVNSNCNGAVTNETGELLYCTAAANLTFPNPSAGTKGNSYNIGSDGAHVCTLKTTSTGSFYGDLGSGAGITGSAGYQLPLKSAATIVDDGTNYQVLAWGVTGGVPVTIGAPVIGVCTNGYNLYNNGGVVSCQQNGTGGGGLTCDTGFTATLGSCAWTATPAADATNCGSVNCIVYKPATGLNQNRYRLNCSGINAAATSDIGVQYHLAGGGWATTGYIQGEAYNNGTNGATMNVVGNAATPDIRLMYFPNNGGNGPSTTGAASVDFNNLQSATIVKVAQFQSTNPQGPSGAGSFYQMVFGSVGYTAATTAVDGIRVIDAAGVASLVATTTCTLTEMPT
jgi:hypothetical protein